MVLWKYLYNIGLMQVILAIVDCATFDSFVVLSCIGYYEGVRVRLDREALFATEVLNNIEKVGESYP